MAKIDTSKIEGFDTMTPEDQVKALTSFEYDDNAGEVERLKNAVTKANGEAADWKKKHHALLSDEEQKNQADAEKWTNMENELNELRKKNTISEHKAQFLAMGYSDALAADTAQALAEGDTAKVFANNQIFLTEHDKAMKADMLKNTPAPPNGSGNGGVDYNKLLKDASDRNDFTAMSYYNRLIEEAKQQQNT